MRFRLKYTTLGIFLSINFVILVRSQPLIHVPGDKAEVTNHKVSDTVRKDESAEKFVATKEWQEIKEGQSIPRGLHVRMNLQTGLKEAKLLDSTDDASLEGPTSGDASLEGPTSGGASLEGPTSGGASLEGPTSGGASLEGPTSGGASLEGPTSGGASLEGPTSGGEASDGTVSDGAVSDGAASDGTASDGTDSDGLPSDKLTGQRYFGGPDGRRISVALEEALKNIATSQDEPSGNKEHQTTGNGNKQEFRSMEEIRDAFSKQNITISSEMEILTNLFEELRDYGHDSKKRIISILEDIEFYLHNFDNAIYFTDLGGTVLIANLLNYSSDAEVVGKCAVTLGVASQSNVYVTRAVRRVTPAVLRHLQINNIGDASIDSQMTENLLFLMSAMVRSDTALISDLNSLGAGGILRNIVTANEKSSMKSKVKVYTLISDLLLLGGDGTEAIHQLLLHNQLGGQLCDSLSSLFLQATKVDHTEKLLSFLNISIEKKLCKAYPQDLMTVLSSLEQRYAEEIHDPDIGDYYQELVSNVVTAKSGVSRFEPFVNEERMVDEL